MGTTVWGMYYLGMMPTADKRLYCKALREAFNSFALKCFRNIWHWNVWPTVDKSVKPFGFVTRQHVSTHFLFVYPSLFCSRLFLFLSPLPGPNPTVKWDVCLMTHKLQFMWLLPFVWQVNSVTSPQSKNCKKVYFYAYSRWISYP